MVPGIISLPREILRILKQSDFPYQCSNFDRVVFFFQKYNGEIIGRRQRGRIEAKPT